METGNEILAVYGPPGTGKTTLLRDVIVARIVERAEVMAGFDDPEKAFRHSGTHRTVRGARVDIFRVAERLRGFEMIVASSNNKAVENVSAELPGLAAIADGPGMPRYFSSISDHVLGHETWGMIAAILGNYANRFAFFDAFWRDEERGLATLLKRAIGLPQVRLEKQPDGTVKEEIREVVARENPAENQAEARRRWKAARSDFLDALRVSRERQARLDELHEALVDPGATAEELAVARDSLASCEKQRDEWSAEAVSCRAEFDGLASQLEDHAKSRARHQAARPNFVARLFRTRAWRAWATLRHELEDRGRRLTDDQNRTQSDLFQARRTVEGLEGNRRKLLKKVTELECRLQELKARQAKLAQHDATVPDASFFEAPSKNRQTASLWYSPEAQRQREELFRRAMALHRAFVEAAADPIRQNLSVFFTQNFASRSLGTVGDDPLEELWATFFMIVPVVSTTFASVDRMLRHISPAALGWLLIDEAGQALPQAAVGALMRSERAVVVGDPLQIEPVVTLPETLTSEICAQFGVCAETYNAPMASAQTLADRASPYCARFPTDAGYRDVGAPLLVHRRCDSPMFEISNTVAYSGLMVQAKPAPGDAPLLGPSKWIHVTGGRTREKWSEEEGRATNELLHALKAAGGDPDVYVITPFVIVQNEMRNLIVQGGVLQGWVGSPQSWVNEHVGTVHTVQGREAAVVIFVLGAPNARQTGARGWAGGRPNILNVAVTRAKSAFYVVGNRDLWRTHGVFQILDQLIQ